VSAELAASSKTRDAIAAAKALDLSVLPKDLANDLGKGIESAETAIASLSEALLAEEAVNAAADSYRPLMRQVRQIEKGIRKADEEMKSLKQRIGRMSDPAFAEEKAALEAERAEFEAQRDALAASIPSEWDTEYSTFSDLTKAEQNARNGYRRAADGSYEAGVEVRDVLRASEGFAALEEGLLALRGPIESGVPLEVVETIKDFEAEVGAVAGADDVKKALSKARRALKKKTPDVEKALSEFDKAAEEYAAQKVWRAEAAGLEPGVSAFVEGIKGTLGARLQEKLTRDQALHLASCTSSHRDLSLNQHLRAVTGPPAIHFGA